MKIRSRTDAEKLLPSTKLSSGRRCWDELEHRDNLSKSNLFFLKLICFSSDCDVWIRCRYHSRRFEKLSCQPTSDGKTRVQTDRNSCSTTKIKCSYWQAKRIWNRWLSSILSSSLNSRLCRISYAYLNDMLPVLFLQRYLEFDAKLEFVLINVNITKYLRTKSATSVNWYVLASAF